MKGLNNDDLIFFKKLYEETERKTQVKISQDAFITCLGGKPGESNLSRLYMLENKQFLYAVYEQLFYRLPDSVAEKKWEVVADKEEPEKFRQKLLYQMMNAEEYTIKSSKISHNVFATYFTGAGTREGVCWNDELKAILKIILKKISKSFYDKAKKYYYKFMKY